MTSALDPATWAVLWAAAVKLSPWGLTLVFLGAYAAWETWHARHGSACRCKR